METIVGIIAALRLPSVIAMNMFIFLHINLQSNDLFYSVLQTCPFIFMISGEIVLNDSCDIEKDRVNKPQRPLVKYNANIRTAFIFSFIMISIGILLAFFIYSSNSNRIALFLAVTLLLIFYNLKNSIIPLIKNPITASVTILSLLFAYSYSQILIEQIFFLIAAFFYILGREMLMDIRDIEGDKKADYKTLAIVLGVNNVYVISCISFFVSSVFLGMTMIINISLFKLALCTLAIVIETICIIKFGRIHKAKEQNKYVLLLWGPILIILLTQVL